MSLRIISLAPGQSHACSSISKVTGRYGVLNQLTNAKITIAIHKTQQNVSLFFAYTAVFEWPSTDHIRGTLAWHNAKVH